MYIDLTNLSEGKKEFDEMIRIDLDDESARMIEPCRIFGVVTKGLTQVDVAGNISPELELECSRCLSPIRSAMDIAFKVAYVTAEFYGSEKESELHGEDLEIAVYDGEKIDLNELAAEQILLNLPTQIFCAEDCQGLCPVCGKNRNRQTCRCETKEIDPRWSALKKLK